ncbi:M90 family metallopeptidase [Yeosuana sp.]|uniref:M90 family metallopeptidase n=1 Tax=Yeosuana sp. TaxID=2529388 RepID=UPI004054F62F|tara:strand:- start:9960 stop:10727 length:768 start_codon:yes stop_codon:yes gene_type:complete
MIFTILIFAIIVIFAIYSFTKLKSKPASIFPKHWHELLIKHVLFYKMLTVEKQMIFQRRIMQFLSEVYIEGVDIEIEELDKILIAVSAVIPVFGFREWRYNNLSGILLYPDAFNEDLEFEDQAHSKIIAGLVGTGRFEKQMILSKKALYSGFENNNDTYNTGIHEFVHLIDKMDGITDGVPERLIEHPYVIPWLKLIHKEMEAINDNKSDIRNYGGTNEAEFFAVASEYFFEQPGLMQEKHPELYRMLVACFHKN